MSAGYYSGGGGRIANATIRVTPDLSGFEARLQASVNKAFANLKVPQVPVGGRGGRGVAGATIESNALRGALIGLSRVTPVTVFGLGAYGTAAIAAGLAIKTAIRETAQFEKNLNTLQAITKVSDEELGKIRQTAIDLGGDVSLAAISAADAAVALTELSKAGLSVKDSLAAVRGVLQLAGAAEITAGEAAKFVATELNAFKLSGDQAIRVVDLLASASIAAQGEITDFGNAFQQVASVASQAGLSVEQTTAALTQLAKAGITSSDAGTSLRTFLLRLIPTTKQAGQFVQALGVQLDNSKTEGEQLASVIDQYRSALLALTPVQRTATLNQIFGQDAIRAASVLLSQNRGELNKQIDALDNAGVAADLNAAKAKGLSGAFAGLQSNLETLGIKAGQVVDGPMEKLIRGINDTLDAAGAAAGTIKDFAAEVAKIPDRDVVITFTLKTADKTPAPLKTFLKENAKFLLPFIGPPIVGLDAFNALTGGNQNTVTRPGIPLDAPDQQTDKFGLGAFAKVQQDRLQREFDRTFGKAADRFAKNDKERRKKIAELLKKQSGGSGSGSGSDTIDFDVTPSRPLVINLLQAQLSRSLQRELAADKAIRTYFEKRVTLAKEGTKLYAKRLRALVSADQAVQSVQGQIDAAASAAQRDREQRQIEREAELKKRTEAAAKLAKATIDLQNERLQTRLSAAQLTDRPSDDIRIYRLQIAAAKADIDRQRALAAAAKKGSQARIDALLQIQEDLQKINGIKSSIKSLQNSSSGGSGGGFSINDLFKEALNQFNEFGSNVSSSVTTLGGVRGALGGAIAAQNPKLTQADHEKIKKAATTNELLEKILEQLQKTDPERATVTGNSQVGRLTAMQAAGLAARRVGGA